MGNVKANGTSHAGRVPYRETLGFSSVAGEARAPTQHRTGRTAWIAAVSLIVLLIALLVIGLATGGSDSSSDSAGGQNFTSFGEQASPGDRAAAARAVHAFLSAQADGDSAKQCALLAAVAQRTLAGFGGVPQKSQTCPQLVEAFRSRISPQVLAQGDRIRVTDVRVAGDRGFVIYRSATGGTSAFAVVREGSAWKVGAIAGYRVG
jgi:hypothetical protein